MTYSLQEGAVDVRELEITVFQRTLLLVGEKNNPRKDAGLWFNPESDQANKQKTNKSHTCREKEFEHELSEGKP